MIFFRNGDVNSCSHNQRLTTKHFTTWYGNFQSNEYKLQKNITSNTVHQLYYKVLNKFKVKL